MSFRRLERWVRRYVEERQGTTSSPSAWVEEPGDSGYLGSSDDRIVAVLIRKLDSTDSRAAFAAEHDLLAVGERAVPRLIKDLGRCPWTMRARMVRVLGRLGAADALPCLMEYFFKAQDERTAMRPGSPTARNLIAPWLIGLDESAINGVDERVYFRIQAVLAYRAIGGSRAIRALCAALTDPHVEVQRFATMALRALASEQPAPELRAALPGLRQLQAGWSNSHSIRRECQLAIQEIERVTVPSEQLPVPAGPLELRVRSLPLSHPNPVNESTSISPFVLEHEA